MTLRSMVERLSRRLVLRRRLPARFGGHPIYVSPDASLRFWRPDIEKADPELLALCTELVSKAQCVWDVGANVGVFAFSAAHLAGPSGEVLAIEPDPWLAHLLRRTALGIGSESAPVEVLQAAVTDRDGSADLVIARRGRATNHLAVVGGSSQSGGSREVVRVPAVTLDHLLEGRRPPDVLKIDVEGAELLCLSGARGLLRTARPTVLCEVTAENSGAIGSLFCDLDYVMLDSAQPAPLRRPEPEPAWNTLAVPRERWLL